MIEAVNSVLSNSSLVRGSAEQGSSARAAVVAETISRIPQAPYVSPYISVDVNFDRAVLQIRDGETGDVVRQFPSESALESARRAQAAQEAGGVFQAAETPEVSDSGQPSEQKVGVSPPPPPEKQASVPQAQLASAALAAGARSGVQNLSAGVTVFA